MSGRVAVFIFECPKCGEKTIVTFDKKTLKGMLKNIKNQAPLRIPEALKK